MVTSYLFLGTGLWLLYQAWRGVVPNVWNPGGKLEAGQRMRPTQRFLFGLGGIMLTALGIALLLHKQEN